MKDTEVSICLNSLNFSNNHRKSAKITIFKVAGTPHAMSPNPLNRPIFTESRDLAGYKSTSSTIWEVAGRTPERIREAELKVSR